MGTVLEAGSISPGACPPLPDEEISMHDFRVVVGQTHTNLIFDVVLNYSCKADEKDVVAAIESEIKKLSPIYNAVINVDRSFISSKE